MTCVMVEAAPYRHTKLDRNDGEVARRRQVEMTRCIQTLLTFLWLGGVPLLFF